MPLATAAIGAGGSIISGILGHNAAKDASAAQVKSQRDAIASTSAARDASLGTATNVYRDDQTRINPYSNAGADALSKIGSSVLPGTPSAADVLAQDPGYKFRLEQGSLALERAESAGGGVGSGGALKAAAKYGQDYASGEYGAAYGRFMQGNQQRYSQLKGVADLGNSANTELLNAGTNYANETGAINMNAARLNADAYTGIGNAEASGIIGGADALGGMFASLANIGQGIQLPSKPGIDTTPVSLFPNGMTSPQVSLGSLGQGTLPTDSGYQWNN